MAKPEWGLKRICQSCAAKFYDMQRSPIVCPKCGSEFDPESVMRSRRGRSAATVDKAAAIAAAKDVAEEEGEEDALKTDDSSDDDESGDGSGLMEDTDDLNDDTEMPSLSDDDDSES